MNQEITFNLGVTGFGITNQGKLPLEALLHRVKRRIIWTR